MMCALSDVSRAPVSSTRARTGACTDDSAASWSESLEACPDLHPGFACFDACSPLIRFLDRRFQHILIRWSMFPSTTRRATDFISSACGRALLTAAVFSRRTRNRDLSPIEIRRQSPFCRQTVRKTNALSLDHIPIEIG